MKSLLLFLNFTVASVALAATSQPLATYHVAFGAKHLTSIPLGGPPSVVVPIIITTNNGAYPPKEITLRYSAERVGFRCSPQIFVKTTFTTSVQAAEVRVTYGGLKDKPKSQPEITYALHAEIAWYGGDSVQHTEVKDLTMNLAPAGTVQCVSLAGGGQ